MCSVILWLKHGNSYMSSVQFMSFLSADGIKLLNLDVPAMVEIGKSAVMTCDYDLEGGHLYSVKWYKDDVEFYRFIPRTISKRIKIFNTTGVYLANSTTEKVVKLENIDISTSGVYKCEVSGESPHFQTQHGEKKLFVYSKYNL
ncbi:hypothetical protein GQR58_010787 [Nymphon striatum]|nr:hypothetical protein GQR58_010787 [Nymphon striatum]